MKIVVLAGGNSTEREISIVSGSGVCAALRGKGHDAVLIDVFTGERGSSEELFPAEYDVEAVAAAIRAHDGEVEALTNDPNRGFFGPGVLRACRTADVVFMALHGANGEDGRVQAFFDLMKIRYTGSGYLGSAIAMNKGLTKRILHDGGVPTSPWFTLQKWQEYADPSVYGLEFPLVVKVNRGGSSVGVYITRDQAEYSEALEAAFSLEDQVVVERYIHGREFSVGVIDGKALPIIEIAPKEGFYDYKNKYTAGSTVETCPALLSPALTAKMQRYAEAGYRLLRIDGYGRLDFLMEADGSMYCLEANTLPGMTPTSLLPQEAAQTGMDFADLCEELIRISLKKYEENA